jgi:hypothetical protein
MTGHRKVTIRHSVEQASLKNLWQAVAKFRRDQREERYREERRRESRLPAHGLARVHWDAEGVGKHIDVVGLLGISDSGCSFRTSQQLAPHQQIIIEGTQTALEPVEAIVRHSTPYGHEYIVGAEIISRDGKAIEQSSPVISE